MNLESNTQFGQYRILRLLGRGGMGEVYEVQHTTLGRSYALKLLPPDFAARPESLARFRREARVMANLEHQNIVRVDEFGETQSRYWLRMELVRGVDWAPDAAAARKSAGQTPVGSVGEVVTLGDYAAQSGGKLGEGEFVVILQQILQALAYAHEKGVVHRDLKPGNILLEKNPQGELQVKVSDFGLARVIGEEFIRSMAQISVSRSMSSGTANRLGGGNSIGNEKTLCDDDGTSTRALLGTWEYMSPEQQQGQEADARSDIYAVGLMCYRLLTGRELGLKKPSQLVAGLQAAWDPFVACAVEQDTATRYAAGQQMLEAFAAVAQAVEKDRQLRLKLEQERQQREAEATRVRAEEEALRARGEEWVLDEARAAQTWQAEEAQSRREVETVVERATAPRKQGQFLGLSKGGGIKFACAHCGQHLEGERVMARREITCPLCKKPISIPSAPSRLARGWRRLTSLVPPVSSLVSALKLKGFRVALPSRRLWPRLIVGAVVLGLAATGGWHLWTSLRDRQGGESSAQSANPGGWQTKTVTSARNVVATQCLNQMKQISLALRTWAMDNNGRLPFQLSRSHGGSAEFSQPGTDGFDANSAAHFQVLSKELASADVLRCPSDTKVSPTMDFRGLQPANVSYQIYSGQGVALNPMEDILFYCPVHKHVALAKGIVLDGNSSEARSALNKLAIGPTKTLKSRTGKL